MRGRVWEGATVTNVALQLAFHMGFRQVILIGVDHSYDAKGKPNTTVVSQGDDPNHFSPAYFGKGFRWQLPDLDTSELGYAMVRDGFERAGRQVLDATVEIASGHVSIGTMHLAKGLEFRAVAVMACDDEIIPFQERIETLGDDADCRKSTIVFGLQKPCHP